MKEKSLLITQYQRTSMLIYVRLITVQNNHRLAVGTVLHVSRQNPFLHFS